MTISSNSVIHFTDDKEFLKGILESGFKINFCRESVVLKEITQAKYIPMVSFCDIPMAQAIQHMDKYGHYGIGMTKRWAVEHKLNPVVYMSKGSTVSENFRTAVNHFIKMKVNSQIDEDAKQGLLDMVRYIKNYEGDLYRKGVKQNGIYRFYDEREWRYVPPIKEFLPMLLAESEYNNTESRHEMDEQIGKIKLEFHADDIKYIILKNETEIHEFVQHLREVKGERYPMRVIEKLTTRIVTAEQIREDF